MANVEKIALGEKLPEVKGSGVPKAQYQSDKAVEAVMMMAKPSEDYIPQPAAIRSEPMQLDVPSVDMNEMVMVTPRITKPRVCIGKGNWYSFEANKKCIVPRHVAMVLEEKGIL